MANKKLTDVDLDISIDEEKDSVISDSNGSIMKIAFSTIKSWVMNLILSNAGSAVTDDGEGNLTITTQFVDGNGVEF